MFDPVLNALPAFALYFVVAIAILTAFLAVYALITPYNEMTLICAGNTAAAASLSGTVIGIALPVAMAIVASHNVYAMLAWGLVACVVQLLVFVVARVAMPSLAHDIPAGKVSVGIFLAALSIGVGILNAASIL
ncbi:MAG TPA: DUF350 domain-containing protein [Rhodocyclaceae bacterium]|nr:DUF350 domain-containing protein [Rhodocyclaceae bacterium]